MKNKQKVGKPSRDRDNPLSSTTGEIEPSASGGGTLSRDHARFLYPGSTGVFSGANNSSRAPWPNPVPCRKLSILAWQLA